jgi:hypothetical protein
VLDTGKSSVTDQIQNQETKFLSGQTWNAVAQ